VKIFDTNTELYELYIFRESIKEKVLIEEIVNPFSGNIISYNLSGINESQYKSLYNNTNKRTICYTSFDDCFQNLQNSIDNDSEDSAICSFFPCSAINYGVCTIAKSSGYIQNASGFIGNNNCSAIYNSKGENVKGLPGNEHQN
jgi:hypothetical protein